MAIPLGSAGAPRWYDLSMERLDVYIEELQRWGATGMEIVLHHGPADDRVARVHVLEGDWANVVGRYHAAGFHLSTHNSLDGRFVVDRWRDDPDGLMHDGGRLLDCAAAIAELQSAPVAFVVHGARPCPADDGVDVTLQYLAWAAKHVAGSGVRIALVLRRQLDPQYPGADGNRLALVESARRVGSPQVGICWDLGHDWENSRDDPTWEPVPDEAFFPMLAHVHVHDAGSEGQVHFPLTQGRVPFERQLRALREHGYAGAVTMEIRWRYAASLGAPWDLMAASYDIARPLIEPEDTTLAGSDAVGRRIREAS